jgi:hypothetical protein
MRISVFWGVIMCSAIKFQDVSEEIIDSIFRVKNMSKYQHAGYD